MGKMIGSIHQHDMPPVTKMVKAGDVWQCDCGGRYYLHPLSYEWMEVTKFDIVTLLPEE